jgi:hypothetical protein
MSLSKLKPLMACFGVRGAESNVEVLGEKDVLVWMLNLRRLIDWIA